MSGTKQARVERKLAAILVADVAGSSRLIEADEAYALSAIHDAIHGLLLPSAQAVGGRLIKTMGDGALVEFASPVEAVACAARVQQELAERAKAEPEERRVLLRIGINLGDVVQREDGDLYGDGVNVAARLEAIADPGGLAISGKVYDELQGKLSLAFEDRGEQTLKNVARLIRVYALTGVVSRRVEPTPLPLPDKPSIAVLPFSNMSGDAEQDYFADGLTEDIITALSRVRWFFVIARNSSFTYRGRAVDVRQVGRELGVRYVLEGSVRRSGPRLRITGQLIEAATGHHVWADRFDGSLEDIFDLQDKITECIVGAIEPSLRTVEIGRARAKPTDNLVAYDRYLRALAEIHTFTPQGYQRARELLQTAVGQDPGFAAAWASLADCLGRSSLYGWIDDVDDGRRLAVEAANRAVEADPNDGSVLAIAAWALAVMDGRVDKAAEYASRALTLTPNSAVVLTQCSWAFVYNGESERTIACFVKAQRLDPFDPRRTTAMTAVALAHFFAKRFDECIRVAERVVEENPTNMSARRFVAAAHAQLGYLEKAQSVVADILARQPSSTVSRTAKTSRFRYDWMSDLYLNSLRLAGLPE